MSSPRHSNSPSTKKLYTLVHRAASVCDAAPLPQQQKKMFALFSAIFGVCTCYHGQLNAKHTLSKLSSPQPVQHAIEET